MHPSVHARNCPSKPALIMAPDGPAMDFAALDALSNQSAHQLRALGMRRGDVIATLFDNRSEVFVIGWAAQRTGLFATSISNKLSAADVAYIVNDSGAKLLVVSPGLVELARAALALGPSIPAWCWEDGTPMESWQALSEKQPITPVADESAGTDLLYSSGTTGRPKGVKTYLPDPDICAETPLTRMGQSLYGMGSDTVYLSTSPLYHAAPLRWALTVQRLGGSVIVMERFDPVEVLRLIEQHKVTHTTCVPTHFVRMLKLSQDERADHDVSSLRAVIHAAAPCPKPVKQAMIDWFGPIIHEYYAGTETCGITAIDSTQWLAHPGSVGLAILGKVHIVGEDGGELGPHQTGLIYFSDGPAFEYLNDPEKTAGAHNALGWATLGDIGYVDEDGYLYLTDRKNFMIISGGVNIYPQEIENLLITHPLVLDVGVIGIPDEEMGERVVAAVELKDPSADRAGATRELLAFAREQLGPVKTPKEIRYAEALPREPTGKLIKRRIIAEFDRYQV